MRVNSHNEHRHDPEQASITGPNSPCILSPVPPDTRPSSTVHSSKIITKSNWSPSKTTTVVCDTLFGSFSSPSFNFRMNQFSTEISRRDVSEQGEGGKHFTMNKRSTSYAKKQSLLKQHEQIYFNINERQILNTNDVRGTFP